MRMNNMKAILKAATLAVAALLLTASASFAQQQVNLTAAPTTTTLPDGTTVQMWGYSCGTAAANTAPAATCAPLNPAAVPLVGPASWSPVVITVPTGQILQINLTNNLSFLPTGGTTPYNIPIGRRSRNDGDLHGEPRPLLGAASHVAYRLARRGEYAAGAGRPRPVVLHRSGGDAGNNCSDADATDFR